MNITVRKAQAHDFPAILHLIKAFAVFQKTPAKVTITLEQMHEDKALFTCFVAVTDDGQIIGFASCFFTYYSWTGRGLYLDDLYVTDAFRKLGVGARLLHTVIDLARQENCKRLRWQVSEWNSNAIDFYQKIGAVIDRVEINCELLIQQDKEGLNRAASS